MPKYPKIANFKIYIMQSFNLLSKEENTEEESLEASLLLKDKDKGKNSRQRKNVSTQSFKLISILNKNEYKYAFVSSIYLLI